jgi:cell division protein FtsL
MSFFRFIFGRVRGFRVLDIAALAVLAVLAPAVYLTKAGAGDTRADIDRVEQQIGESHTQIRLLQAEVAAEEQPERLASLSAQFKLQPIAANHEISIETLGDIAQQSAPAPRADPLVVAQAATAPVTPGAAQTVGAR